MEDTFVYMIKNIITSELYIGVSSSTNEYYNPVRAIMNSNKTDKNRYVKICKSIAKHGKKNFIYGKSEIHGDRYECEKKAYQMILKLGTRCLNDNPVDPERSPCEHCQKMVRKVYEEEHKKYCSINLESDFELFN